ncbi:hypothetical protein MYXA107069_37590 [Myxococcus xanthus]
MNQSRCWANDTGNAPMRGTRVSAGTLGAAASRADSSIRSASPSSTGDAKSVRRGNSTPKAERMCAMSCVASNECPPNSKKSASALTRSMPSTSHQMMLSFCSVTVRGSMC